MTSALSERGHEFEAVEAQDLLDETVAIAGVSTPLPGGTGYIYRFETNSLAEAAVYNFDRNHNEVEGCGSYVFYSDGRAVAADRWRQEVRRTLRALDSECRDGFTFGIA